MQYCGADRQRYEEVRFGIAVVGGIFNAVVPDDQLLDEARTWAHEIAANAPMAVQTTKRMMRMGLEESFETAFDHLMSHLVRLMAAEDFKEGLSAFMERRDPTFKGS